MTMTTQQQPQPVPVLGRYFDAVVRDTSFFGIAARSMEWTV
jgi:hypothetical protein